jgi:chemotaxis protein methyltransferase CheR
MDLAVFEHLRRIIYRESGIVLTDDKQTLLLSRIQARMIELELVDPGQYLQVILDDSSEAELTKLVDAISTNTTYFYREPRQFDILRNHLNEIRRAGQKEIKIWCAAASTGEEPYTLCFESLECTDPISNTLRILGTDISTRALRVAIQGIYPAETVKPVPNILRLKYMEALHLPEGEFWRVRANVRSNVLFKRFNLTRFPYKLQGGIDVIFLRNVMIYFDLPTRQQIVDEMSRLLNPGGLLVIGVTESLLGVNHYLTKVDTSVFKKGKGGK